VRFSTLPVSKRDSGGVDAHALGYLCQRHSLAFPHRFEPRQQP